MLEGGREGGKQGGEPCLRRCFYIRREGGAERCQCPLPDWAELGDVALLV